MCGDARGENGQAGRRGHGYVPGPAGVVPAGPALL